MCVKNYLMNSRDWARPVSTKIEEKIRTTKLDSRKVESDQGGLMSYGTYHTLPPAFCCLPGSSWIPLTPFDALHRIRGFQRFEFREFIPATACVYFIPSCFSLMFDVLLTVINSVYVQTFPTEQATPAFTDSFSRGHDPFAHACKARPLTIVGRTSLSVSLSLSLSLRRNTTQVFLFCYFCLMQVFRQTGKGSKARAP